MNDDIRIVVFDPHPLVRAGLIHYVGSVPGMVIQQQFGQEKELLAGGALAGADVVVMDCFLDGRILAAAALLGAVQAASGCRVVVFTAETGDGPRALCAQRGVDAFVDKREPVSALVDAVRSVMRPRRHRPPSVGGDFLLSGLDRLSAQEHTVMRLVAQGKSTQQIAGAMQRTKSTVSTHKVNALRKLCLAGEREFLRLLPDAFVWPERSGVNGPRSGRAS